MRHIACIALLLFLGSQEASAQYFGRNKPRYQKQDFKVTQTPHFEIYEYLNNPDKLKDLADAAELWYNMHQGVLRDTFTEKNPLIIYNDHAGFQQTTAISGDISVGTGGVTEGLRNRVVFPVAMTNQQTHHVLGHELVHAFQYHIILEGDSTNMNSLGNIPLWMIEGLAEYLSIGRVDAHTALWMRDAVMHNNLPRIKDLNNTSKYFPYRWGQAFWAFVAGSYGDEAIKPLFVNTAKYGLDGGVKITLNTTLEDLSIAWQEALKSHYGRWIKIEALPEEKDDKKKKDKAALAYTAQKDKVPGKRLLSDDNAGDMNVCPVLSPNGKYVIFLSEKNLFTTDLFLADAKTGKIMRKVASAAQDGHIDQFNAIESAGTWAPDDKRFAFDVYEKGRSVLVIKDVFKKKTIQKISMPGVPSFSNPAWSPDGKRILVSGLVDGQTDLFVYELKSKKVRRLTNDKYAEILPAWSPDGQLITYSTDQLSIERGRSNGAWKMNLAVMDYASGEAEMIDVFPGADNLNPHFDKTGNLLFLSDRDGFRNLYKYDTATKKAYQLTQLLSGITGITAYAPAITVAEDRDRILFTYFENGNYVIYQVAGAELPALEVPADRTDMIAATLPPFDPRARDQVNTGLRLMDSNTESVALSNSLLQQKYRPKFKLDYLGGGGGMGVATGNSSFGVASGLAGGVDMLFSDILGNNQLYAGLGLNGEIIDAAGQFSYINQKKRVNWGVNLSHIPFLQGRIYEDLDKYFSGPEVEQTLDGQQYLGYQDTIFLQRQFQERIGAFTFYPLSTTKRIELGGAYEFYHFRYDATYRYIDASGFLLGQERQKIQDAVENLNIYSVNTAFVGDNSYFGFTAPLQGWRYRIGLEQYFGDFTFSTLLLDGRKYMRVKPFTLAVRGMTYARFGGNSDRYPLLVANPWFIRGYTSNFLINDASDLIDAAVGSKLAVANVEIRLPFTGPKEVALIPTNFLLSDLNIFFDAGVAFNNTDQLKKENPDDLNHVYHKPLLAAGVSLRVNLFGALILEPYYALPLSAKKEQRRWLFGLNILPGW